MSKCEQHDKVFAQHLLTSNPPRRPWICRVCKEQGSDAIGVYTDDNEYEELRREMVLRVGNMIADRNDEALRRLAKS